ncbi:MAG: hypothetical protein HRT93_10750 [Piscirickettsiaceae bacterium]|nr:hypothetical protein [Piscirickettsiaceae bacterium]
MNIQDKLWCSLFVIVFFIVGCNTVSVKKELTFNALILDNNSGTELENVRIQVKETGAFLSCGVVLRGRSCSTTFQTRVYQGNSVYISWQIHGKERIVGPLHVELPLSMQYELPARIVIKFDSINDVTAKFKY